MAKSRVIFTSILSSKWVPKTIGELDAAVLDMVTRIHGLAVDYVQKDTRTLAGSGRFEHPGTAHYVVIFGGNNGRVSVPYGRIQHEGGTIRPKRGKYLKFKNKDGEFVQVKSVTIKGTKYLERAGDSIARNGIAKFVKGRQR